MERQLHYLPEAESRVPPPVSSLEIETGRVQTTVYSAGVQSVGGSQQGLLMEG